MFMLADHVDVVIGVDTHRDTHTAAVVLAATGAVMEEVTISTDPAGYAAAGPRGPASAVGGCGPWKVPARSTGAGLARFLTGEGEWVVEADRPHRPARRNGAKSDALDAARAGREVLGREHLSRPARRGSTRGVGRAACGATVRGGQFRGRATPAQRIGRHRTRVVADPIPRRARRPSCSRP